MKKLFTLIAMTVMAIGASAQTYFFQEGDVASAGSLNGQTFADGFISLVDTDGKMAIDGNNAYFGDAETQTKYSYRLKSGGKSSSKNQIHLTVAAAGTLKVYARTGSNSATDRNLVITQNETELYNQVVQESNAIKVKGLDEAEPEKETNVYPAITATVTAGEVVITYPTGSMNFYGFEVASGDASVQTMKTTNANDGAVFNLAGQKVGNGYKGIAIQNGKKVVNK